LPHGDKKKKWGCHSYKGCFGEKIPQIRHIWRDLKKKLPGLDKLPGSWLYFEL
jgi:hypothetical protein